LAGTGLGGRLGASPFAALIAQLPVMSLVPPSETTQQNFIVSTTFGLHSSGFIVLFRSQFLAGMKTSILAAAGFASSALAGVHRMKLEKIPLAQQLVSKSSLIMTTNLHID